MRTLPALVALALFSVSLPALADGPSFAIGVGGIEVPGTVSVFGAQAALVWPTPDEKRDLRAGLLLWSSTDDHTKGKGGLIFLEQNLWWGVYGLGYGAGIGQASFSPKTKSGWDGSSPQTAVYFSPLELRFGQKTKLEISIDIGATRFFDSDTIKGDSGVRPYGMTAIGGLF